MATLLNILSKIAALLLLLQSAVIFSVPTHYFKYVDLSHLPPLELGDWVLRAGTVLDSKIIMEVSHSDYSHIGMIVQITPQILVIHATTDDGYSQKNQVFLSPLKEFVSSNLAENFLILRPHFLSFEQKKHIAQLLIQDEGKAFLLASRDQPHLYCTTLLENAIQKEYPAFKPHWTKLDTAFFSGEYLFPNAFQEYENVEIIFPLKSNNIPSLRQSP